MAHETSKKNSTLVRQFKSPCPNLGRILLALYDFNVSFTTTRRRRAGRIVISGIGCVTPLGNSRAELWDGFRNARSGIRRISAFDPSHFPVKIAGEERGIDALEYFHAEER